MQINIGNYRIRRYDKLNLCVEVRKEKQKAKNPYGRNGKKGSATIIQNNLSNKVEYKYHLVGYFSTLDYCLKHLIEHCLTNNEEISTSLKKNFASEEYFDLFSTYQQKRHTGSSMSNMTFEDFKSMIETSPINTQLCEFRNKEKKLIGLMLFDHQKDGLSAVYSFYDIK